MENIKRRILIIEDSEKYIHRIINGFSVFYGDKGFVFLNKGPVSSIGDAKKLIDENICDVILLDHNFVRGECGGGLIIADLVEDKIKNEILILSISIALTSEAMIDYRKKGVVHFPGKDFIEIKKCIDDECKCHLL